MVEIQVLVVDDELSMREFLAILLSRQGYRVTTAASAEHALTLMETSTYQLVLTDLSMPGIDGLELVRRVRRGHLSHPSEVPIVMVTAYGTTSTAVAAMKEGATDYVLKPFDNDELLIVLNKALGQVQLAQENRALKERLGERFGYHNLIGTSAPMEGVYEMVRRVKDSRISCLIEGESGTGKELVARAIHYSGARAPGPFVAVNCGAIPENLIESELFGYKKGAFTGALRDKEGMFSAADGGTLFLDEVGEMPLHTQVKLLRAIAERKIVAVGDHREHEIDVRIVAATNRNLEAEVAEGRFREDLYYRLNVVHLGLPPLRSRGSDIQLLAERFVEEFAKEYAKPIRGLAPETLQLIRSHSWPGNVRELRNALEGAVALETEDLVTPRCLPSRIHRAHPASASPAKAGADQLVGEEGVDLDSLLGEVERRYLEAALDRASGNKTKAAKLLQMSFRSFRYRLAKFGMDD
jgi:two-component system response regulator PilR (NtrC family)